MYFCFSVVFDVYRDSRVSEQQIMYVLSIELFVLWKQHLKHYRDETNNSFIFLEVVLAKKNKNKKRQKPLPSFTILFPSSFSKFSAVNGRRMIGLGVQVCLCQ